MKRVLFGVMLLLAFFAAKPASAAGTQLLIQTNLGPGTVNLVCLLKGCQVTQSVTGSPNNFFVLSFPGSANAGFLESVLQNIPGS